MLCGNYKVPCYGNVSKAMHRGIRLVSLRSEWCQVFIGAWRSPVAHLLWEQGAVSSNLTAPTRGINMRIYGASPRDLGNHCPCCWAVADDKQGHTLKHRARQAARKEIEEQLIESTDFSLPRPTYANDNDWWDIYE